MGADVRRAKTSKFTQQVWERALMTQDFAFDQIFRCARQKKPPSFSAWHCRATHTEVGGTHWRCTGLPDASCCPKLLLRTWRALGFVRFWHLWNRWCNACNHRLTCQELPRGHQRYSSHMSTPKHQQKPVHCEGSTPFSQSWDCWD